MGFSARLYVMLFAILFLITGIGECSERQEKDKLTKHIGILRSSGPIPDLGVEPTKKPTKYLNYKAEEKECLSKEEFYEGMENAEMRGVDDDPSAQDIYDEFNR